MGLMQLFLISIGLAMDAFAVSICKGLCIKNIDKKSSVIVGLYFGIFQALMPIIGFFLGGFLKDLVVSIDHWIVFVLLVIIGANMIFETMCNKEDSFDDNISFKSMFLPALATSIDAFAVGVTFAFLEINIIFAVMLIGIVAFLFTVVGVRIGSNFGNRFENKAKLLGGCILILIGIKILLEHLF